MMSRTIELPGDKSISHRIALIASISEGACRFRNYNTGADCASTLACLQHLGAAVRREADALILDPAPLRSPAGALNCGNSGSTIRMLTGLLAGRNIPALLTGDASLLQRPMRRVAEPLRQMGADIVLRGGEFAPIELRAGVTHPIQYTMPISSAQVKSAILFAGLRLPGTSVAEPVPSRDHTERLLGHLGIRSSQDLHIPPFDYDVPGDPSSAAFILTASLLMRKDGEVCLPGILVNPHRIAYVRILQRAGARIELRNERILQNEPVADLIVTPPSSQLSRIVIAPSEVPSVIDEIPALAVIGTMCGFEVSGASELRYKETDRIAALAANFRELKIAVQEDKDALRVEPGRMQPAIARTYGDHRIAMAFAAAGLQVDDPECVRISFPEFFELIR